MKRLDLFLIITIMSINCKAQSNDSITVNLRQIEFVDHYLIDVLARMAKESPECFTDDFCYVLIFFQKGCDMGVNDLGNLLIAVDRFDGNQEIINSLTYYTVINNLTYFLSDKTPKGMTRLLSETKTFRFDPSELMHDDDFSFVVYSHSPGFYYILTKSCDWLTRALEPQYPWSKPNNAIRMQKSVVPTHP